MWFRASRDAKNNIQKLQTEDNKKVENSLCNFSKHKYPYSQKLAMNAIKFIECIKAPENLVCIWQVFTSFQVSSI